MAKLNHHDYYRLPWNLADNGIAWLEPTTQCNLACYGCYRRNDRDGHKSLEEIDADLDVFQKFRKIDGARFRAVRMNKLSVTFRCRR